jgi:predicted Rossmann fold nucleotide-binding protein DprA/Smf involved in DNA uptake
LVENADDVLRELAPRLPVHPEPAPIAALPAVEFEASPDESAVLDCLSEVPVHIDPIVTRTGLPTQKVLQILLSLELRGAAVPLPGKRFTRRPLR